MENDVVCDIKLENYCFEENMDSLTEGEIQFDECSDTLEDEGSPIRDTENGKDKSTSSKTTVHTRKRRKCLTFNEKFSIIHARQTGVPTSTLATKYNVNSSTISKKKNY